jgi:hypothetical protein
MRAISSALIPTAVLGVLFTGAAYSSAMGSFPPASATDAAGSVTAIAAAPIVTSVRAVPVETPDACAQQSVAANATRPAWDYAASSTQCGVVETDYGFLHQPVGSGVSQEMMVGSVRYGLTPKLDFRWSATNHIWQNGGGVGALQGVGDEWLGARFRFHEQGRLMPAMAFLYAGKTPAANPAKGFGSGFVDHQFLLIASRDLGKNHFDFNTVGTVAGAARGHDGAAQFGLAYTRPLSAKLSVILESYGGPQPWTTDRFGAAFAGAAYTARPQLVLDCAFSRTFTAGSPREQVLIGVTYAQRSGFGQLPRSSGLARVLGR